MVRLLFQKRIEVGEGKVPVTECQCWQQHWAAILRSWSLWSKVGLPLCTGPPRLTQELAKRQRKFSPTGHRPWFLCTSDEVFALQLQTSWLKGWTQNQQSLQTVPWQAGSFAQHEWFSLRQFPWKRGQEGVLVKCDAKAKGQRGRGDLTQLLSFGASEIQK